MKYSKREKLLRSMALQQSIKTGTSLTKSEMQSLISDLYECSMPGVSPNGKPVIMKFKKGELDKMFGRG